MSNDDVQVPKNCAKYDTLDKYVAGAVLENTIRHYGTLLKI